MKLIGITADYLFDREEKLLSLLFDEGLDTLHLRKPLATLSQTEALLRKIPDRYYPHIVLHDHFNLVTKYNLRGIHLNRRCPVAPSYYKGTISRSCHAFTELAECQTFDYVFLSPVYDSISKTGYSSAFSGKTLSEGAGSGLINEKVIALGGVTPERIPALRPYGFGGVAVLGWLWQDTDPRKLKQRFQQLIHILS